MGKRFLNRLIAGILVFGSLAIAGAQQVRELPLASQKLVFEEVDGLVVVEAEHFFRQEKDEVRAWHLTTKDRTPDLEPDADPNHVAGASGGAYLEILPDTRKNHGEKLIGGENFQNNPGRMAVISYRVHFNTPGKYYVWARIYSTGTEDNGMHVGIDGTWPASGRRMQWTGKNRWIWNSKQRTQNQHGGVRGLLFIEVEDPGVHVIQFSMREDGFEFDQWLMTQDRNFAVPPGPVPISKTKVGTPPQPFELVAGVAGDTKSAVTGAGGRSLNDQTAMTFRDFSNRQRLYLDGNKWLAVNPFTHQDGKASGTWPFNGGTFDLVFHAVGENDGRSRYEIFVEGEKIGDFQCPLSEEMFEEGAKYNKVLKGVRIGEGATIEVRSAIDSQDGQEFSRARWSKISARPADGKKMIRKRTNRRSDNAGGPDGQPLRPSFGGDLFGPRGENGTGEVAIGGELKQWHKVTLTLDAAFAHEMDNAPNPFVDYRFEVEFTHAGTKRSVTVPGFFAADGEAGETSARKGTKWRAHFAPDATGEWTFKTGFITGNGVALDAVAKGKKLAGDGRTGKFVIGSSDKLGRDLRAKGRLSYVGKHHLQFEGTKEYFLKAGADAPETFLGYADFDGTTAGKVKLKTWGPHIRDWKPGDPTWKNGKGKGMIGAINYLSGKGCNVFSFLTYNAGGDGDNVWPFVERNDKLNYDCSKLDQWGIVFDHGTAKGMYLHFKLQETEMDDKVPTSLDRGDLGPERKLYCREMVARFGHNLALNWNLGEENSQTTEQQRDMARYLAELDPYDHLIVVHTFPNQQDKVYRPLLGAASVLRGTSLQNSNVKDSHYQTVKWIRASVKAGVPWVIAFDEPGNAGIGMPADPGYPGMPDNFDNPSIHTVRQQVLWGNLLGGGGGVEYYFGYQLPQNDLVCEDWRSRDLSWGYCDIALTFFRENGIPFHEMSNQDELIGNPNHDNSAYCFAKPGEWYLVYFPNGGKRALDLSRAKGTFSVSWFDPRNGGAMKDGGAVKAGAEVILEAPAGSEDWLAVVKQ